MDSTAAFRLLASADRQHAICALLEADGETTVEDLSRSVAAKRHRARPASLSESEVERAQIRLIHIHFPKLIEQNVIAVDWDDRSVRFGDESVLETLLEAAEELGSWPPNPRLSRLGS